MTTAKRLHYSYEDYLRLLERSEFKLEYCDGVIYAMAGGTPTHAELSLTVGSLLREALLDRCRAYSSDLKVRIEATDLSTFPDVSIVCGETQPSPIDPNALVNPAILVEVTSRSTEDYDRGDKLSHYKQIPTLKAVVFVSHREQRLTLVERTGSGWQETDCRSGETLSLAEPAVTLKVDDVYRGVTLESA